MAEAVGAGARLFKAHLQAGGYDPRDPLLDPVLGMLAAPPARILLGSDFPNLPCRYLHQLQALARLELGPQWLRAVCHDNAARLLGL